VKALIALTLLTLAFPQTPPKVQDTSGLEITQFSYKTKLIERESLVSQVVSMQPPVLNPSTMRQGSKNENSVSTVQRDTSQRMGDMDTLRIRSGASFPQMLVPVFAFQAQMRNYSSNPITRFVWAYRSSANPPDFVDPDSTTWQRPDWIGTILLTRAGARNLRGKCIAL
jgi:hypothetical protein